MLNFQLAVCGLHLQGQPLNMQLTELGATFVRACKSAALYRLYAITDDQGIGKPGMVRSLHCDGSAAIDLEIWELPIENVGRFMLQVPPPLGIGTVELEDGSNVKGFICEAWVAEAASCGNDKISDITHFGGWVQYSEQH